MVIWSIVNVKDIAIASEYTGVNFIDATLVIYLYSM